MESQKHFQAVTAVAQTMSLMQDQIAFNNSNLMENYSREGSSFPGKGGGGGDVGGSIVPDLDYDDAGGNYSVNLSFLPSPNGTVPPTPPGDYVPYSMRPETYIIPVLFAIIFIIGVVGNGTLIVIFLKHRSMRNVPNMSIWTSVGGRYICSLAVGDILVIFFCVPFTSTVYTVESWPYGVVVCKFSEFIKDLSIGVSVFTLTALSADRYFAIVDPMRKLTGRRATRITCITIVGIWLVSILFALPSLIFSFVWTVQVENTNKTFDVCYPFPKELTEKYGYPKLVVMGKFFCFFAIPLFFIATFYIIMAHHLLQSTRNMPGEAQGQMKQIQSRKKVAKMVLSFVLIFALCFFPSHVFLIWFYYYPNAETHYNLFWHWVRMIGFCFSFINSCINPITLYCVSGTFRKHFNRHLLCCYRDDRRSRHRHNHFTRTQASGYHSGISHSHTDHIYADRIHTNGATQYSRVSKSTIAVHCRSRQNSQQLLAGPLGNNNGSTSRSPSLNGNNGNGGGGQMPCENEFEMATRKVYKKPRILSAVEEQSDKFELIRAQQHCHSHEADEDDVEKALLGEASAEGNNTDPIHHSSCM